jgi:predicted metal-dependent peptidase
MAFQDLTHQQRISAVNIDCMRHHKFALLSGVIPMGKSEVVDNVPTACTNGKDKQYGRAFIDQLNRKQLRYLVLHENFHVALKHCVLPYYLEVSKKAGHRITNIAMDHVINNMIEELDPSLNFVERPTDTLCCDAKYKGMSFIQVLRDLMQNPPPEEQNSIDEHQPYDGGGDADGEGSPSDQLSKDVDEANRQGKILSDRMAGSSGGGRDILETAADRMTDWRDALREFIQTVCQGDDNSRFCPPNKRLLASGFVMPSHFNESVGELVIAGDTSGSMTSYYSLLFGELARICQTASPESVRVLWWDTAVRGEQVFTSADYDNIAKLVKPKGGGGTTPQVVTEYMAKHRIQPQAVIWLTDGYIGSDTPATSAPSLWGVVDNDSFVPTHGKLVRINL